MDADVDDRNQAPLSTVAVIHRKELVGMALGGGGQSWPSARGEDVDSTHP